MVPYGSYDHSVHRLSHNSNDFLGNPSHFVFADCDTGRDLSVQHTVSTPIVPNIFPTVLYWSWIEGKKWTLGVESISECVWCQWMPSRYCLITLALKPEWPKVAKASSAQTGPIAKVKTLRRESPKQNHTTIIKQALPDDLQGTLGTFSVS